MDTCAWGLYGGTTIGAIKGDTRSLDYSSYAAMLGQSYPPEIFLGRRKSPCMGEYGSLHLG